MIETSQGLLKTGPGLVRTRDNFRKIFFGTSLAALRILELSCQGLGMRVVLECQGLECTGVSVRVTPRVLHRNQTHRQFRKLRSNKAENHGKNNVVSEQKLR